MINTSIRATSYSHNSRAVCADRTPSATAAPGMRRPHPVCASRTRYAPAAPGLRQPHPVCASRNRSAPAAPGLRQPHPVCADRTRSAPAASGLCRVHAATAPVGGRGERPDTGTAFVLLAQTMWHPHSPPALCAGPTQSVPAEPSTLPHGLPAVDRQAAVGGREERPDTGTASVRLAQTMWHPHNPPAVWVGRTRCVPAALGVCRPHSVCAG
jgi:hypothetical protein